MISTARTYVIWSHSRLLRDTPEHIDFHIKNGDYFAFLAGALAFVEEKLESCDPSAKEVAIARELRSDLRYVHSRYEIGRKEKAETIRPKGNLLA